ncbi:hypothetical protein HDU86_004462 [Geranomyces michiganensis]|nr:hypothetical protein HDU86_004462 [Geranomyces michiganensis]
MSALKRKAVAAPVMASVSKKQQKKAAATPAPTPAAFLDPYIDPSDDEEDSEIDEAASTSPEAGPDFAEESDSAGEDEQDGSEGEEDEDEEAGVAGQTKRKRPAAGNDDLYRAPTNDEMHQLKETGDLFKSNLFKLQIDELLSNVRVDQAKMAPLEMSLRKVKEILDTLDDMPDFPLSEAVSKMKAMGVTIPFPSPPPPADAQYKFGFKRPAKVFIVGSYLLKAVSRSPSGTNVDMAVQMPDSIFTEKDSVNYRYFYKRAYYVAVLAAELRKQRKELGIKLEFEAFQGDSRRPVLVIRSAGKGGDYDFSKLGFSIRILVTIPQTLFTPTKLAPGRNNVRPTYLGSDATATAAPTPTPRYNAALLQETAFVTHMNLLHHHATTCGGFREACILAKVWLTQRGFSGATAGFSGFLFSMLLGYLLRTNDKHGGRRLGNNFSSYQLLKVTMEFIANHDFNAEPVFMTPDGKPLDGAEEFSAQAFINAYDVVMVDPSGRINLAAGMTRAALDELQYEARRTSEMFKDVNNDHFDALFLRKVDVLHLHYDNVARIAAVESPPAAYTTSVALDYPTIHEFLISHVPNVLKRALNKRVSLVSVHTAPLPTWAIGDKPASHASLETPFHVGLMLKGDESLALLELGPSADDQDAAEAFRKLWGPKSELRRFKDGSIAESVLFDCDGTLEKRSLIVGQMLAYLVQLHAGASKDGVTCWAGQLNKFLHAPGIKMQVASYQGVMDAYNKFSRNLRLLEGLPLSVTQTVACAEGLRYTSVFVPQPRLPEAQAAVDAYRPYHEPLDVLIEFESSPRWPSDLRAIELTKRAFYIKIAELFMQQHPGHRATVSTGSGRHVLDSGNLEVTTDTGYTFRCTIHHERQHQLLQNAIAEPTMDSEKAEYNHALALAHYERTFVRHPRHSTRMQNLCLRFPHLPQTVRLVKRWLAAHLLSPQIAPELIEIICAKQFVDPAPFSVPSSGFVGFLRTLDLFRSHPWRREPLIVELEKGEMSGECRSRIAAAFRTSRGFAPDGSVIMDGQNARPQNPAMWVATEMDVDGKWWGMNTPGTVIVERIKGLATAALSHVEGLIAHGGSEKSIAKLFTAVSRGYDAFLRLDSSKLPRFRESLSYDPPKLSTFKNLIALKDRELALLSDIDPAELYVADLTTAFGDSALFFHDRFGGDVIGVVWNPLVMAESSWKVDLKYNAAPSDENEEGTEAGRGGKNKLKVKPNALAMVAEMQRLGEGLVLGVDLC